LLLAFGDVSRTWSGSLRELGIVAPSCELYVARDEPARWNGRKATTFLSESEKEPSRHELWPRQEALPSLRQRVSHSANFPLAVQLVAKNAYADVV
jgi:hypothetical protein